VENSAPAAPAGFDLPADFPFERSRARVTFLKQARRKLTKGLPQKNVYTQVLRHAATTDTCEAAGVYLGTTSRSLFYSRDEGSSWQLLQDHLPPVMSLEAAAV
jgi:hypothetical protein